MESPPVEIRQTRLGQALFATAELEPGQEIGTVEGTVIHDPDYGSEYCIGLDDQSSLEPNGPFRFLNHCCEPTCELIIWECEDSGERRVAVHAIQGIQVGGELTIDYAWSADVAIDCLCGATSCRGWIVDPEQLEARSKMRSA